MSKDFLYTVAGTILGSLIEEGIEEFFPGVGELGPTGEIVGGITGLLSSNITKKEVENSLQSFIKYVYRQINAKSADEAISEEELRTFSEKFKSIPQNQKKRILNNFRTLSPYEYHFIYDFLEELKRR
jgi:hypothetical protein